METIRECNTLLVRLHASDSYLRLEIRRIFNDILHRHAPLILGYVVQLEGNKVYAYTLRNDDIIYASSEGAGTLLRLCLHLLPFYIA